MPIPDDWSKLQVENLGFSYDKDIVFKGISFDINRGEVIAVQGPSGIGKSTFVNILLKLTEPDEGRILLDGQDFTHYKKIDWLSRIGASGQDFELPEGSIADNLMFGGKLSEEAMIRALETAEIADFVLSLPEGLNTKLGDRGVRLSGGQRQRIMLARALARNPEILILDEATSAVSMDVEEKIYDHIKTAYPDMTIILITHRKIPDGLADKIINIQDYQ